MHETFKGIVHPNSVNIYSPLCSCKPAGELRGSNIQNISLKQFTFLGELCLRVASFISLWTHSELLWEEILPDELQILHKKGFSAIKCHYLKKKKKQEISKHKKYVLFV